MSKPAREPVPPPTAEQLALAFRQVRRPHWPDTLEQALQVPVHACLIRLHASRLGRASVCTPARKAAAMPPAAPHAAPALPPLRPAQWDARRAAANDLDDE